MTESENRRCAVVTGSTRGIGRAVARELAAAGMNVVVNSSSGRSLPAAEAVAAEIAEEFGVETLAVAANVAIEEEANAFIAAATEANGRVDVLVNNAGITRDGLAARMSDDDFDAVIDINLKGTFHCCRAAAKLMMKQRWGRIVNMSSVVGVYGNAGQVNYAASKAGVIGLTKSLARELARRNITANAVAPGFIATDMTDALSDAQREAIVSRIGSGRLGEPDDIAHLVRFLASDEASYITGQVICVDGKRVRPEVEKHYIIYHKPAGEVTTVSDPEGRATVLDRFRDYPVRLYPVGRLDYDTEGLLILTTDGDLCNRLTHPSSEIEKVYSAKVEGEVSESELAAIRRGVEIDGKKTKKCRAVLVGYDRKTNHSSVEVAITEGMNREVRKMFEAVGRHVTFLKRVAIGDLRLRGVDRGSYRKMTAEEIDYLKNV